MLSTYLTGEPIFHWVFINPSQSWCSFKLNFGNQAPAQDDTTFYSAHMWKKIMETAKQTKIKGSSTLSNSPGFLRDTRTTLGLRSGSDNLFMKHQLSSLFLWLSRKKKNVNLYP